MKKVFLFLCAILFCGTMSAQITEESLTGDYKVTGISIDDEYNIDSTTVIYFRLKYDDFEEETRLVKVGSAEKMVNTNNYCTFDGTTLTIEPYMSDDFMSALCYCFEDYGAVNCPVTANEDGTLTFQKRLDAITMNSDGTGYKDFGILEGAVAVRCDDMPDPQDDPEPEEKEYTFSISYTQNLKTVSITANEAETVVVGKYADFFLIDGEEFDYENWLSEVRADACSVDGNTITIDFGDVAPVDGNTYSVTCYWGTIILDGKTYEDPVWYDPTFTFTYNTSTGIENVNSDQAKNVNKMYDLQGRRIVAPRSGQMYLMNGKKFIAK